MLPRPTRETVSTLIPVSLECSTPVGVMTNWRDKYASRSRTILAHAILAELREEAKLEASLQRFDQCDDTPRPPEADPLASAQSRRALPVEVH